MPPEKFRKESRMTKLARAIARTLFIVAALLALPFFAMIYIANPALDRR